MISLASLLSILNVNLENNCLRGGADVLAMMIVPYLPTHKGAGLFSSTVYFITGYPLTREIKLLIKYREIARTLGILVPRVRVML